MLPYRPPAADVGERCTALIFCVGTASQTDRTLIELGGFYPPHAKGYPLAE